MGGTDALFWLPYNGLTQQTHPQLFRNRILFLTSWWDHSLLGHPTAYLHAAVLGYWSHAYVTAYFIINDILFSLSAVAWFWTLSCVNRTLRRCCERASSYHHGSHYFRVALVPNLGKSSICFPTYCKQGYKTKEGTLFNGHVKIVLSGAPFI